MHFNPSFSLLCVFFAVLDIAHAAPQRTGNNNGNGNANAATGGSGGTTLDAANIQDGSQQNGDPDATAGQSASLTDDANFINFCSGKTITNGLQNTGGSCNGIVMGDIPSQGNMISSIIVNPAPGDDLDANTDFNIQVQVSNLVAGTFTNPDNTYYAAPQQLQGGKVVGHTHVTVQDLGNSLTPNTPPNAGTFAFFKGINDDGNGNGLLSATVAGGLPAGNYRVCTMTSSSNHQPVLMPVAQRGAQDDCTKFTVGGSGGGNNNAAGTNNAGGGRNGAGNTATGAAQGAADTGADGADAASSAAAKASTTTTAARGGAAATTSTSAAANNGSGRGRTGTTTSAAAEGATTTSAAGGNGRAQTTTSAANAAASTDAAAAGNGRSRTTTSAAGAAASTDTADNDTGACTGSCLGTDNNQNTGSGRGNKGGRRRWRAYPSFSARDLVV